MKRLGILAVVAGLLLTGCSAQAPVAHVTCLDPADNVAERIADGASGAAITPSAASAIEAPSFDNAYLVALRFTVEGDNEAMTGVWAAGDINGGATTFLAVDGYAHSFTTWPNQINGETLDATEPGVDDVKGCLDAG